jgi:SAM-dependent methyltransferase
MVTIFNENPEKVYEHISEVHNLSAPRELVPYIVQLLDPKSVLDVGCGLGTFLCIFKELGVNDIYGIDGSWVDKTKLYVGSESFKQYNLEEEFDLNRRFDVVLCLEVAEHIRPEAAQKLVRSIVKHSDVIVFSAAIPNQVGQHHVNEQYPDYWMDLFGKFDFDFYDLFRPIFWTNSKVDWWYRQNMFLAISNGSSIAMKLSQFKIEPGKLHTYVHPDLFQYRFGIYKKLLDEVRMIESGKKSLGYYLRVLKRRLF